MSSEACGRLQAFFRSRTDAGAHPADQSDAEQDTCATGGQLRTVDIDGIRLCQPCEKLRDPGRDAIVHRKPENEVRKADPEDKEPDVPLVPDHGLQQHLLRDGGGVEAVQETGGKGGSKQNKHI